jgi:hypothetical protein
MKVNDMINKVVHKNENLLKLLLIMKMSLPSLTYFYVVIILIKFLGMFIVSNFFLLSKNIFSKSFVQLLRKITSFGIFSNMSYALYSSLSYVFLILILIYLGLYLWAYKLVKSDIWSNSSGRVNKVIRIINCLNVVYLLLAQHFIEYFSFIYYINFISKENTSHTLFNQITDYLLIVLNSLGIIFMNIFMIFAYNILNEPTNITKSGFKLHVNYYCITTAIICTNLQAFHFIDEIESDTNLFNIKLAQYVIILLLLLSQFIKRLHIFYFRTVLFYAIQAVYSYCFFSCIIEIIVYLISSPITDANHIMGLFLIKVTYSIIYILLSYYIYESRFQKQCNNIIFKEYYNDKFTYYELQTFYYFQSLMITSFKNKNFEKLNDVVFSHRAECSFGGCICKKILHDYSNLSIILENIYNRLNFVKNSKINLLYFEYLLLLRKSDIFAYSIVKTYLHKNRHTINIFEKVFFNLLLFQSIDYFNKNCMKALSDYPIYNEIWSKVSLHKLIEGSINDIIKAFEYFIDFKEKFDNCLKFENGAVNSFIFNDFNNLVYNCVDLKKVYKNIKNNIKDNLQGSKCLDFELSYKLSLFFKLFNKKIPGSISRLILSKGEELYNLLEEQFTNERHYSIIFSINQIFEVKYFSYKLAKLMGHTHSTLIGSDLHNIFPEDLRENHKKVILKHILIDNKYVFHRRTMAFTNNNANFQIALRACAFTSFSNELEIVCDIEVLPDEPKIYYFVLDTHFEMISMNRTFEQAYYLDFDLLRRLGLDVLKLMDIPRNEIKERFREVLTAISTQKELKNFFFIFNNLFSLNLAFSDVERNMSLKEYFNIQNNQPLRESETIVNINEDETLSKHDTNKIALNKSTKSLISPRKSLKAINASKEKNISIQRDRHIIIHILEKMLSWKSDLDLESDDIKKLESSIKTLKLQDRQNNIFKIDINLKNFIDTVFYIVKIEEEVEQPADNVSICIYESFAPKSPRWDLKSSSIAKVFKRSNIQDTSLLLFKDKIKFDIKPLGSKKNVHTGKSLKNNKSYLSIFVRQKNTPLTEVQGNKNIHTESIILFLVILLIVVVFLHAYLFYYKTNSLNTITSSFKSQFWMNYQNLSLNFLHSAIITWMFELAGLSIKSANYDRQENIKHWTNLYRNSFFRFYDSLDEFDNATVLQSMHTSNIVFNKISIDWENIQYNTSAFSELNYLQYAAYSLTQVQNTTIFSENLRELFLFEQYSKNVGKDVTNEDKALYFINKNTPTIFLFMKDAEVKILEISENIFENTKTIVYVIDGLIIGLFLFLIIFVRIILHKFDTKLFKLILAMFIDNKSPKECSYKTPIEIGIIKTNIKNFKFIMENIEYEIKEVPTVKNLLEIANQNKIEAIASQSIESQTKTLGTLGTENKLITTTNGNITANNNTKSDLPFVNGFSKNLIRATNTKAKYDRNGNAVEDDIGLITNNNILNDTKHYELRLIKVLNYFLLIALAIFTILTVTNMMISSKNFNFFNEMRKLSESFIGIYTSIAQLFNYTRLSVFNYKKIPDNQYYTYDTILADLTKSSNNFTQFSNNYNGYLTNVENYMSSWNTMDATSQKLFCPDKETCELNSKGVTAGYLSSLRFIELIYSDFQKQTIAEPTFNDIQGYFYNDQYNIVLSEVEFVLGNIATSLYDYILVDFNILIDSFHGVVTILGLIWLVFTDLVIVYIIFVFSTRMKIYLDSIVYSANKFNTALYKD